MTKKEQIADNAIIEQYIDELNAEISVNGLQYVRRLRSCSAHVYETKHFKVLRSYNTIVAAVYYRTPEAAPIFIVEILVSSIRGGIVDDKLGCNYTLAYEYRKAHIYSI